MFILHGIAIQLGANPFGRNIVEYNEVRRTALETHNAAIGCTMDSVFGTVENLEDIPDMVGHIIRYNLVIDTFRHHHNATHQTA